MTPDQLSLLLQERLGRPASVLPVPPTPCTWRTTVLRDAADRPVVVAELRQELQEIDGLTWQDGAVQLHVRAHEVPMLLAEAAQVMPSPGGVPDDDLVLELTRDGRSTTYGTLAEQVGDAAARWVVLRSAGRGRVDLPVAQLARRVPGNPVHAVPLAHARLLRDQPTTAGREVVALLGRWPQVARTTSRTGRTRLTALHLEQLAAAVLHWLPQTGPAPDGWTAQQVAEAARRVLATGLTAAGIPAPARI